MTLNFLLIVVAIVVIVFMFKRAGQISPQAAAAHLKSGALVIDVRSPGEFSAGHLPVAFNVPLDQLDTALPRLVKEKSQVLLLHCLSGTRSGMAKAKLKRMGYPNVFNLGSYGRAENILRQASGPTAGNPK